MAGIYGIKAKVDNAMTFTSVDGKQCTLNKGDLLTFRDGLLDDDQIILMIYKNGKTESENITVKWTYEIGEATEIALATDVFTPILTKADFEAKVKKNKTSKSMKTIAIVAGVGLLIVGVFCITRKS